MEDYEEKNEIKFETPKSDDIPNFKEFYNLSGFYLKLSHIQDELVIIIYDIEKLDGVKYEMKIKLNDIYQLSSLFKGYSNIQEIYNLIIKLINENSYSLKKVKNEVIFLLKMKDILNNIKEIQFIVGESNNKVNIKNNEYINVLINEIKQMRSNNKLIDELKEENKYIKNEINKLKSKLKINDIIPSEDLNENKNILNINDFISLEDFNKKFNLRIKNNDITELELCDKNYNDEIVKYVGKLDLKRLKKLFLSGNDISNINGLIGANFEELEEMSFNINIISDISALEKVNFKNLKELWLYNNIINDITPLGKANFEKLEILSMHTNNISDISILEKANLISLKTLNLHTNNISNLTPLKYCKFKELENLSLHTNKISDITPIQMANFKCLKVLYLNKNEIDDISILNDKMFENLDKLSLSKNKIDRNKYEQIINKLKSNIVVFDI